MFILWNQRDCSKKSSLQHLWYTTAATREVMVTSVPSQSGLCTTTTPVVQGLYYSGAGTRAARGDKHFQEGGKRLTGMDAVSRMARSSGFG